MEEDKTIKRRTFLKAGTIAIGGLIGLGIGLPAIGYIVGPAMLEKSSQEWISIGAVAKVEIGIPTLFKVKIEQQTGWIVNEEELSVYILTDNGRDYIALSNICTHLGCRVRWISDQNLYFCPCHNANFDKEGLVLSGPPPKPLDRYDVKVENNQIYIKVG